LAIKLREEIAMPRRIGRIYDWSTELEVESGFTLTHITLQDRSGKVEIELDKYKVRELIKLLEESIK
jgi:hypothetical protein